MLRIEIESRLENIQKFFKYHCLRRTKLDVLALLPKTDNFVMLELTQSQRRIYCKVGCRKERMKLDKGELSNVFMEQRKICNSSLLANPILFTENAMDNNICEELTQIIQSSSKMKYVDEQLEKMKNNGEKVLIFS